MLASGWWLPFVSVAAAVDCRLRAVCDRWQGSCSCVDLGSSSRCALALMPVCVPTASAVARAAARAPCRSHLEIQPYHSGRSRAELGPGLEASTPVRRDFAARSACLLDPDVFYYIKLEDEEPREVAGSPSNDGPPARLGQRPEARPERREREGRREP